MKARGRFAGGIAGLLNKLALDGKISDLIIIAAPHTLGESEKTYHKKLLEFFAERFLKILPAIRCTILRKQSLRSSG